MLIIRNPNIELIRKRARKGTEINPLNAESFGRNWIGPVRKNLLIPKDEAKRLMINVIRGRMDSRSSKVGNVVPALFFG